MAKTVKWSTAASCYIIERLRKTAHGKVGSLGARF